MWAGEWSRPLHRVCPVKISSSCFLIQLHVEWLGDPSKPNDACYLTELGGRTYKIKNLLIEMLLPDGSVKASAKNLPLNWEQVKKGGHGFSGFFSSSMVIWCLLSVVCIKFDDGRLIMRVSADIMMEGWYPYLSLFLATTTGLVGSTNQLQEREKWYSFLCTEWCVFFNVGKLWIQWCQSCVPGWANIKRLKNVLSAWSAVVKAMFTHSDMVEGQTKTVADQDIKPNAMKALIRFMYGGYLQCEPEDQLVMLAAADKFYVQSVKSQCLKILIDRRQHSSGDVPEVY